MRKRIRRGAGSSAFFDWSWRWMSTAHCTASTTLANSASTLSPGASTTRPPWPPTAVAITARYSVIARTVALFDAIGSPGYPTSREERERMAASAFDRAYRPAGIARQTHGILATGSFEHVLGNVKAPTQVIHGVDDPLVRPEGGKRTAALIKGAKLELIKGMGHDFPAGLFPRWVELVAENAARA